MTATITTLCPLTKSVEIQANNDSCAEWLDILTSHITDHREGWRQQKLFFFFAPNRLRSSKKLSFPHAKWKHSSTLVTIFSWVKHQLRVDEEPKRRENKKVFSDSASLLWMYLCDAFHSFLHLSTRLSFPLMLFVFSAPLRVFSRSFLPSFFVPSSPPCRAGSFWHS